MNSKENLSLLWYSCINNFTLKNLCTAHLFEDPVNGPLGLLLNIYLSTLLPLQWFSTGTVPFCHSQDIIENWGNASDCHNFGGTLLGPGTV